MSEVRQHQRQCGRRAFVWVTLTIALAACSSTVPSPVVISGSWTGAGSDTGAVQWTLTQADSSFSGTVAVLEARTANPSTIQGTVSGTVERTGQVSFQQSICIGPIGANGLCEITVVTTGNLKLENGQLTGDYLGAEQPLRSPPGPVGVGNSPFVKGSLTLKRVG
jgi:hypothetical protein